jgi:hypothetical protein
VQASAACLCVILDRRAAGDRVGIAIPNNTMINIVLEAGDGSDGRHKIRLVVQ